MTNSVNNSIKLIAVGDISFGDFPFCPGIGIRSSLSENKSPFIEINSILSSGDIVFGNLETCLSDFGLDSNQLSTYEMRGKPDNVIFLQNAGFNVLNMANNHTMQHGLSAFSETVKLLTSHSIKTIGLKDEYLDPLIIKCKDKLVGFLGFAFEQDNYGNEVLGYSYAPVCSLKKNINSVKQLVDILIVSCHWGVEFINRPSLNTVLLGRKIVDWGADIVLGHHPHVVQGLEYYKTGLIIYSLGNFLFDMLWCCKLRNSFIFDINININANSITYDLIPVTICDDYIIKINSDSEKDLNYFEQLCEKIKNYGDEWDWERATIQYYTEYFKLLRCNRYRAYAYFLKHINKIDHRLLSQIINRTFKRWASKLCH